MLSSTRPGHIKTFGENGGDFAFPALLIEELCQTEPKRTNKGGKGDFTPIRKSSDEETYESSSTAKEPS